MLFELDSSGQGTLQIPLQKNCTEFFPFVVSSAWQDDSTENDK